MPLINDATAGAGETIIAKHIRSGVFSHGRDVGYSRSYSQTIINDLRRADYAVESRFVCLYARVTCGSSIGKRLWTAIYESLGT